MAQATRRLPESGPTTGAVLTIDSHAWTVGDRATYGSSESGDIEEWECRSGTAVAYLLREGRESPKWFFTREVPPEAVALPGGGVLVSGDARNAELLVGNGFRGVPGDFGAALSFAASAVLADGGALIAGGYDEHGRKSAGVWRFSGSSSTRFAVKLAGARARGAGWNRAPPLSHCLGAQDLGMAHAIPRMRKGMPGRPVARHPVRRS